MSGHSKWSTIKRAKGLTDIKRGQTFTKLANVITIAVRLGGSGDADSNPRLRVAVDAARAVNMPKENMQRSIDRGLGKLPGQTIDEVSYEGFGPGKVGFIVEGLTDNKMRTTQEIKNIFERSGGGMGAPGSVVYMFDKLGEVKVKGRGLSSEEEILELIDLGAEDVEEFDGGYLVYTEATNVAEVGTKITQAGYTLESQELIMKPKIIQEIKDPETAKKVLEFTERLEDLDDVLKVYANFDIADDLVTD